MSLLLSSGDLLNQIDIFDWPVTKNPQLSLFDNQAQTSLSMDRLRMDMTSNNLSSDELKILSK